MEENYIEIEMRYRVKDVPACLQDLKDRGISVVRTEHLVDEWYAPVTVKSLEQEQEWFDERKGIAWRIRRIGPPGSEKIEVTSKQLTEDNNHNSFIETTAKFDSYDDTVYSMEQREYRNWLTIDKTRYLLTSAHPDIEDTECELIVDEIAGLKEKIGIGACLEIEYKATSSRDQALKRIEVIADLLGFQKDDQFEKSLTVTSMTELARF